MVNARDLIPLAYLVVWPDGRPMRAKMGKFLVVFRAKRAALVYAKMHGGHVLELFPGKARFPSEVKDLDP